MRLSIKVQYNVGYILLYVYCIIRSAGKTVLKHKTKLLITIFRKSIIVYCTYHCISLNYVKNFNLYRNILLHYFHYLLSLFYLVNIFNQKYEM